MSATGAPTLEVGEVLHGWERVVSHERVLWYGDGLMTGASSERRLAFSNIHTDEEYAQGQGLPAAIADGMHSTNWISSMLLRAFGQAYVEQGQLRTKYIKPTLVGIMLKVRGKVRCKDQLEDGGVRYIVDVWTEDSNSERLTVGEAIIEVPRTEELFTSR